MTLLPVTSKFSLLSFKKFRLDSTDIEQLQLETLGVSTKHLQHFPSTTTWPPNKSTWSHRLRLSCYSKHRKTVSGYMMQLSGANL